MVRRQWTRRQRIVRRQWNQFKKAISFRFHTVFKVLFFLKRQSFFYCILEILLARILQEAICRGIYRSKNNQIFGKYVFLKRKAGKKIDEMQFLTNQSCISIINGSIFEIKANIQTMHSCSTKNFNAVFFCIISF